MFLFIWEFIRAIGEVLTEKVEGFIISFGWVVVTSISSYLVVVLEFLDEYLFVIKFRDESQ